jgi:type IV fimbrial biogenesis protein FimT
MLKNPKYRGFTLIEMIVSIAIIAVLVSLAVPSFKIMLANAQIRTAAQGLLDGMQLARVEAIRLNERVIFTKDVQSGWTVRVESVPLVIVQTRAFTEGSEAAEVSVIPNGASKITFDGLGRVKSNTDLSNTLTRLDISVPTTLVAAADARPLRITTTSGGAIRLCDPNAAAGTGAAC